MQARLHCGIWWPRGVAAADTQCPVPGAGRAEAGQPPRPWGWHPKQGPALNCAAALPNEAFACMCMQLRLRSRSERKTAQLRRLRRASRRRRRSADRAAQLTRRQANDRHQDRNPLQQPHCTHPAAGGGHRPQLTQPHPARKRVDGSQGQCRERGSAEEAEQGLDLACLQLCRCAAAAGGRPCKPRGASGPLAVTDQHAGITCTAHRARQRPPSSASFQLGHRRRSHGRPVAVGRGEVAAGSHAVCRQGAPWAAGTPACCQPRHRCRRRSTVAQPVCLLPRCFAVSPQDAGAVPAARRCSSQPAQAGQCWHWAVTNVARRRCRRLLPQGSPTRCFCPSLHSPTFRRWCLATALTRCSTDQQARARRRSFWRCCGRSMERGWRR